MIPYKFTGKLEQRGNPDYSGELDQETGLYYYGARYYDPVFLPQILNEYIYPEFRNAIESGSLILIRSYELNRDRDERN